MATVNQRLQMQLKFLEFGEPPRVKFSSDFRFIRLYLESSYICTSGVVRLNKDFVINTINNRVRSDQSEIISDPSIFNVVERTLAYDIDLLLFSQELRFIGPNNDTSLFVIERKDNKVITQLEIVNKVFTLASLKYS